MTGKPIPRYCHIPNHRCNFNENLRHGFTMIQADGPEGTADALNHLHVVVQWCSAQYDGTCFYRDPQARWVAMGSHIWFRDDNDAFAFKMRWC